MSHPSFGAKIFVQLLKKAQYGSVLVTFPDGKTETFGDQDVVAHVKLKNWSVIDQLIRKGDIGLAEGIIENEIEVDDMAALIEWACKNDQALGQALHGTLLGTLMYQINRFFTRNSKKQAKKNIVAHYDLGNDFYKLWLDPTMSYSSALYQSEDQDLTQAQLQKYDRLIDQLNIKSGDHILEIGCGWGGFFSRAVERTGCKVTAVMNSPGQAAYNRQMIDQKGFKSYVDLQEMDYRDIQGKYDTIVSIEMIEAVGKEYWGTYFDKVSSSLKSNGAAMIQGITIRDDLFYSYSQKTDFIQNYVFPGGMLLSNSIFKKYSEKSGAPLVDTYEFGLSYAKTLNVWREKFDSVYEQVKAMGYDDRFIRLWRLYLSYCEGAFRAGRINVGHYELVKES